MISGSKNRHTQHRGDLSINRGGRQCGLGSVQNTDEILADCERVVARYAFATVAEALHGFCT
jgi:hypothetical protein